MNKKYIVELILLTFTVTSITWCALLNYTKIINEQENEKQQTEINQ